MKEPFIWEYTDDGLTHVDQGEDFAVILAANWQSSIVFFAEFEAEKTDEEITFTRKEFEQYLEGSGWSLTEDSQWEALVKRFGVSK